MAAVGATGEGVEWVTRPRLGICGSGEGVERVRGSGEGDRCWLGLGRAGKDRLGAVFFLVF